MKISRLYIYPIKSLRGCSVSSATLTAQGLAYDRKYMLVRRVQTDDDGGGDDVKYSYKHLTIGRIDALCLFTTAFYPTDAAPEYIRVTYNPPADQSSNGESGDVDARDEHVKMSIDVPAAAEYSALQPLDLDLHGSRCVGYDMGLEFEAFFTRWLGFPTKLVYIGDSTRESLGNLTPGKEHVTGASTAAPDAWSVSTVATSGFTMVGRLAGGILTRAWAMGGYSSGSGSSSSSSSDDGKTGEAEYTMHFSDCAPLLVTSEVSLEELNRGKRAVPLDMTKTRPNIVIGPSQDGEMAAFEEDFWSELAIRGGEGPDDGIEADTVKRLLLTSNCGRCKSLNVDYVTGKQLPVAEQMLKRLADMKRRVDPGHGYSPIFGRYGFIEKGSRGRIVAVGDTVDVSRRNVERTVFFWPGLSAGAKKTTK
ncbi:hypothetical protein TWF696_004154 [Orbilia brochopaga]|uniref:MOSC domain-containing protein n=1 Tax=Orbilia brochopaga TaxID=3140254 RepID=A0AAV9V704_9PEZI